MRERGTQDALLEVYMTSNEPQNFINEFSSSTKTLDAECKLGIIEQVT
jgi:hypothetical protein